MLIFVNKCHIMATMSTIRLTVNEKVETILNDLEKYYHTLDRVEIIKLGLSKLYTETVDSSRKIDAVYRSALKSGRKVGNKLAKQRGYNSIKDVPEDELYSILKKI